MSPPHSGSIASSLPRLYQELARRAGRAVPVVVGATTIVGLTLLTLGLTGTWFGGTAPVVGTTPTTGTGPESAAPPTSAGTSTTVAPGVATAPPTPAPTTTVATDAAAAPASIEPTTPATTPAPTTAVATDAAAAPASIEPTTPATTAPPTTAAATGASVVLAESAAGLPLTPQPAEFADAVRGTLESQGLLLSRAAVGSYGPTAPAERVVFFGGLLEPPLTEPDLQEHEHALLDAVLRVPKPLLEPAEPSRAHDPGRLGGFVRCQTITDQIICAWIDRWTIGYIITSDRTEAETAQLLVDMRSDLERLDE